MNIPDEHEAFLDFIHSVRNARKIYSGVLARFASIDSACKRITPSWSAEGGHSGDSQSLWAERADEATRVQRAKDAVDGAVLTLEALIEQVPDKTHRSILRRRYVRCLPWPSICAMLPMSERTVFRAHREALKAAEAIWKEGRTDEDDR